MPPPFPIPADVQGWLLGVFGGCNERISGILTDIPTMHETPLDMTFIQHFVGVSAPHTFGSGWTVDLNTHFLGGGHHYMWGEPLRAWEVADIGLLVIYRQAGKLVRSKVALLQSKRLYANELDWDEDTSLDYEIGFGRLLHSDDHWSDLTEPQPYGFTTESRYKALVSGVGQYEAIRHYEAQRQVPVYYLLYNPSQIPSATVVPVRAGSSNPQPCEVGCRVVPAGHLRTVLDAQSRGSAPSYASLLSGLPAPFGNTQHRAGWRLEHFVVNLVLECEEGYIANGPGDAGLDYIFNRRTGPISAALAITLDAPG